MKTERINIHTLWPLLLPIIIMLRDPNGFPYPVPEALYSDISISHYPNMVYLKKMLGEFGILPLWSPLIFSGTPFAANPLSGLWYLPGWLAILLPLPLGINLTAALHLVLGGVGFYLLLIRNKLSHRSAIFGSLVFMSSPKIVSHFGAGHLTLLYAISWTPWLLLSSPRVALFGKKSFFLIPIILALIFLADPRWVVYSGVVWIIYVIANNRMVVKPGERNQTESEKLRSKPDLKSWSKDLVCVGYQGLIAILLSGPLLFPLLEYTNLSTRSLMTPEETTIFSLPFSRILGLLFPDFGSNHEWTVYLGVVVLVLVLISAVRKNKKSTERFWLVFGFLAIIASFGGNLPFYQVLNRLPGFQLLRVPSRSLFLTGISFAIVSAHVIDDFLKSGDLLQKHRISLGLTALTALSIMMTVGVWVLTQEFPIPFVYGSVLTLVTSMMIGLKFQNRIPTNLWYLILVGLALVDWNVFNTSVLTFRPKQEVLSEQSEVAEYLAGIGGYFRVYSPSYSLPQQVAVNYGLESVSGVDPLSLASYSEFMIDATGIPSSGYSVTLPPFKNGDPRLDNANSTPNPSLLGLLNVGYVVSEYDLEANGLELQEKFGTTRVYQNLLLKPRAWIQPLDTTIGNKTSPVEIVRYSPNQIEIKASGPGLMVLSEIAYPGWKVKVDDRKAEMRVVTNILRGVVLNEGDHDVAFIYRPTSVYLGLVAFFFGIFVLLFSPQIIKRCGT